MKKLLAMASLCLIMSSNNYATDLSIELDSGYDSNPFQLADVHQFDSAAFIQPRIKYRQKFENSFYLVGNLKSTLYSGESDADETRINFGGGVKKKFKIGKKRAHYKFEARYYQIDQTYISRNTGLIAVFSGQQIADRYDANWFQLKASSDVKLNRSFTFNIEAEYRDKNYQSYETLGLSNLDYSQYFVGSVLVFNSDKENRFKFGAEVGTREYDNRVAKLLDGTNILGSNLEYNYQRYSFDYRNKKDKFTWSLGFNSELREDSGGGFYDTVKNRAYAKAKYKRKSGSFISAKLSYLDHSFDNSIPLGQVQNDEELRAREGYVLELEYNRNLVDFGYKELFFHTKLSYADYDNADPFYIYDQSIFQIGLKWNPL